MSLQEREQLYKTIWSIANDLRGSVDGWDFKSYVLGMLLYRFLSEDFANYINSAQGISKEDKSGFASLKDTDISDEIKGNLIAEKGFFIYPSQLFSNVCKSAKSNQDNLNETLLTIFQAIEASAKGQFAEDNIQGLFNEIDVNSIKLGSSVIQRNKRLLKIMQSIDKLSLDCNSTIDIFGDAYEYLLSMYASNAGKSGGGSFSPLNQCLLF